MCASKLATRHKFGGGITWSKNAIQPTAIGKRNWLFVGEAEAGELSAIITPSLKPAAAGTWIPTLISRMC